MNKIPRCVITGNQNGKSIIIKDAACDNVQEQIPGLVISDIWATNTMPVDMQKQVHIENTLLPVTPTNGTYFRYVSIPPDSELKNIYPSQNQQIQMILTH